MNHIIKIMLNINFSPLHVNKNSFSINLLSYKNMSPSILRVPSNTNNCPCTIFEKIKYFNPRSREGSDLLLVSKSAITNISIHAPAKGATLSR